MNDVELRESNEVVCDRCFIRTNKHRLIQAFNYLGTQTKRMDLCENCFEEFINWFGRKSELLKILSEEIKK